MSKREWRSPNSFFTTLPLSTPAILITHFTAEGHTAPPSLTSLRAFRTAALVHHSTAERQQLQSACKRHFPARQPRLWIRECRRRQQQSYWRRFPPRRPRPTSDDSDGGGRGGSGAAAKAAAGATAEAAAEAASVVTEAPSRARERRQSSATAMRDGHGRGRSGKRPGTMLPWRPPRSPALAAPAELQRSSCWRVQADGEHGSTVASTYR